VMEQGGRTAEGVGVVVMMWGVATG
jgi:hypothetical protein